MVLFCNQVWRPSGGDDRTYNLVGQTMFRPSELRFQEVSLKAGHVIQFRQGDVLGLYFPLYNPIAWSSVPCATEKQNYLFALNTTADLSVGTAVRFSSASANDAPPGQSLCRHYSFTAILSTFIRSESYLGTHTENSLYFEGLPIIFSVFFKIHFWAFVTGTD